MNLGSIELFSQRRFESSAPKKSVFRIAARHHFKQRFFQFLVSPPASHERFWRAQQRRR
jgi:hypothetical protein